MKRTLLLIVTCLTVAAHGAVTLRIDAEPDALLPGLPPSLRIWIGNDGPSPVEVPARAALQVVGPQGQSFIAFATMRGDARTVDLAAKTPLVIAAGETRDLSFWSGDSWFLADARFRTIGEFRLQLIADHGLDSLRLDGLARVLDQPGLVQPLVSNETRFTVLEPAGPDLAVWNLMKDRSAVCTAEVTDLIWRDHPDSRYAAYCVQHVNDPDEMKRIAGHEASLAKSPHAYWADGYRLAIAQFWISRAAGRIHTDAEAAVDAYAKAREILEPLARTAVSPRHRREAADLLETRVLTRAQVIEEKAASRGFDARTILFGVSCYERLAGGMRRIWFGYNNPNSKAIDIAVGNDNKFTPPPFDRKQPTSFRPGIFNFAFHIVTKEPTLVWHLQGKTAQFKLPDTIQCPKGFDPNDPSTWQVEEE